MSETPDTHETAERKRLQNECKWVWHLSWVAHFQETSTRMNMSKYQKRLYAQSKGIAFDKRRFKDDYYTAYSNPESEPFYAKFAPPADATASWSSPAL